MHKVVFISLHYKNGLSTHLTPDQMIDSEFDLLSKFNILFAVINYNDGKYEILKCIDKALQYLKLQFRLNP